MQRSPQRCADVAVLIPCRNEEVAVAEVVSAFRAALPQARILVYDNASSDRTAERAAQAGADVRHEPLPGKGNVVRRMFADVDAAVYILVDGDGTYDAASAPAMVRMLLEDRLDLVTGVRVSVEAAAYRPGHRWGNAMLTGAINRLFGRGTADVLSGYRVMSRRFVKSFPCVSSGFEIETELTVHALSLRLPMADSATPYVARREGCSSKLRTFQDGWRILRTIMQLVQHERPLGAYGVAAMLLAASAAGLSVPLWLTWLETGLVPRLPTAVLCSGLMLLATVVLGCGFVLDSSAHARRETKRLAYLALPPPEPVPTATARAMADVTA